MPNADDAELLMRYAGELGGWKAEVRQVAYRLDEACFSGVVEANGIPLTVLGLGNVIEGFRAMDAEIGADLVADIRHQAADIAAILNVAEADEVYGLLTVRDPMPAVGQAGEACAAIERTTRRAELLAFVGHVADPSDTYDHDQLRDGAEPAILDLRRRLWEVECAMFERAAAVRAELNRRRGG